MADFPPVVLVHGLASSSDHGWRPSGWIDLLEEAGREVVAIDLPGHGTSHCSADPADYRDVAATLAAVFADRGPVDAVGFSVGAQLLLEIACRKLAAFGRLALLGVGPTMFRPLTSAADLVSALDDTDSANVAARMFRGLVSRAGNDLSAVTAFARRPVTRLTADDLDVVTCKVLVVTGERDPSGSPEELAAMFRNAEATGQTVDRADHFSLQANMRAMDAVLRFLDV